MVVGVEFRNASGKHGVHPFPAGLNDCAAALDWVVANKARLGIGKLIISGESGGGNLTLATMLKARREGRAGAVDGGLRPVPVHLRRLRQPTDDAGRRSIENNGYFLDCAGYERDGQGL